VTIGEAEGEWYDNNKKESSFIREKDLKNHLTATIETVEEKKNREESELKERIERTERFRAMREKKKLAGKNPVKEKVALVEEDEDGATKIAPGEDWQVTQAINYLKNIGLIKGLKF